MSSRREEERSGFDYDSDPSRFASLDDYAEDDDAYVAPETFTEDVNLDPDDDGDKAEYAALSGPLPVPTVPMHLQRMLRETGMVAPPLHRIVDKLLRPFPKPVMQRPTVDEVTGRPIYPKFHWPWQESVPEEFIPLFRPDSHLVLNKVLEASKPGGKWSNNVLYYTGFGLIFGSVSGLMVGTADGLMNLTVGQPLRNHYGLVRAVQRRTVKDWAFRFALTTFSYCTLWTIADMVREPEDPNDIWNAVFAMSASCAFFFGSGRPKQIALVGLVSGITSWAVMPDAFAPRWPANILV